jgi:hypothetical protein
MATLRERFDRLIAGRPSDDPLEISNRSIGQKVALAFLIAFPFLLVVAVIVLVMPGKPPTVEHDVLTPAEIAERMLPGIDKTKIESNRDIEVLDAHLELKGAVTALGTVRNNTDHSITGAEVTLTVVDSDGSILGAVAHKFEKLAPHSTSTFRAPIPFKTAYMVLVRDVKTP